MVTYVYRCSRDGAFDVRRTMGQAATSEACPSCGADARRIFTTPRLAAYDRRAMAAHDRAARSADTPAVVSSLPRT